MGVETAGVRGEPGRDARRRALDSLFLAHSGRKGLDLLLFERRRFPHLPPVDDVCDRHNPAEPHRLRHFEAPPLQKGRLPMNFSLPRRNFPVFYLHPMVVVRID